MPLIAHCDDVITNNYIAIETRENRVEEIVLSHQVDQQIIEFLGSRIKRRRSLGSQPM